MPTPDSSSDAILLDDIADEFARRQRDGELPTIDEYVSRHPDLEKDIRQVLATLERIENARPNLSASGAGPSICGPDGQQITQLGDYRILREVGRGGMGVVFEAEQVSLGRRVALKALPQDSQGDTRQFARFQLEARATASLEHPHIVPIHNVGEDDNLHYFTMQFIDGPGLGQVLDEIRLLRNEQFETGSNSAATDVSRILRDRDLSGEEISAEAQDSVDEAVGASSDQHEGKSNTKLTGSTVNAAGSGTLVSLSDSSRDASGSKYYRNVAQIGMQIADALECAHAQGILHRDVKPSNILLDLHGKAWITDFGLAKTEDTVDVTNTGDIVGTLRYMSPERFDGWADRRSDVYSLGLTLYELATLQPAFGTGDRAKLVQSIRDAACAAPRTVDPQIPADLETIILKAIAREPGLRYRTAAGLREDLRRFLAGQPILARRTSTLEKLQLWVRRNPLPAALVVLLFVALTAGFATSTWYWHQAASRAAAASRAEKRALGLAEIAHQKADEASDARVLAAAQRDVALKKGADLRAAIDQLFTAIAEDPELKKVSMEKFRRKMLERANSYYDQFHAETPNDPELAWEHAQLTFKLAEMNRELGDLKSARKLFVTILNQVDSAQTPRPGLTHLAYKCRLWVAECSWKLGEDDHQLDFLIRESEKFTKLHSADMAAKFLTECAHMATTVGRTSDAWELSNRADELWKTIKPQPDLRRQHDLRVALHCTTRSRLALELENYPAVRDAAQKAVDLLTPYGPGQMVTATIADMDYLIALSLSREQRFAESTKKFRHVIRVFEAMQQAHPNVPRYRFKLLDYHYHLALDLHRQNQHQEALNLLTANLNTLDLTKQEFPEENVSSRRIRGDSLNVMSRIHEQLGNIEQQGRYADMAIDVLENSPGDAVNLQILTSLGNAWMQRARYCGNAVEDSAAEMAAYDRAIEILEEVLAGDTQSWLAKRFLAEACLRQAELKLVNGELVSATSRFNRVIELNVEHYGKEAQLHLNRMADNGR